MEFGIGCPSELVSLLLEGFIIEMATTSWFLSPLSWKYLISGIFKHLYVDMLGGKDRQSEIARKFLLCHTWNDDKWSLSWLIECVESCNVIVLEVWFFIPLAVLYLEFSLQILKLWRLEFWDVFASFLFNRGFECICVCHTVHGQTRDHLVSTSGFASDYLRSWRCRWTKRLGNHQANWNTLNSPTALLFQDNF